MVRGKSDADAYNSQVKFFEMEGVEEVPAPTN